MDSDHLDRLKELTEKLDAKSEGIGDAYNNISDTTEEILGKIMGVALMAKVTNNQDLATQALNIFEDYTTAMLDFIDTVNALSDISNGYSKELDKLLRIGGSKNDKS